MDAILRIWEARCASSRALRFVDINLRGSGQVMFQDNPLTGLLFLAPIAWGAFAAGAPEILFAGILAVVAAALVALGSGSKFFQAFCQAFPNFRLNCASFSKHSLGGFVGFQGVTMRAKAISSIPNFSSLAAVNRTYFSGPGPHRGGRAVRSSVKTTVAHIVIYGK